MRTAKGCCGCVGSVLALDYRMAAFRILFCFVRAVLLFVSVCYACSNLTMSDHLLPETLVGYAMSKK